MRALKYSFFVLIFLVMLFFVSFVFPSPKASEGSSVSLSRPPVSLTSKYRDADNIIIASCVYKNSNEIGRTVSRFLVKEVLEGSLKEEETINIFCDASEDVDYLLYLSDPSESEDGEYGILTGSPLVVNDGLLSYEGRVFSLKSIVDSINTQRNRVTIPSVSYYYGDFSELINSCSEVLIGKVIEIKGPLNADCRSFDSGESIVKRLPVTFVTIMVENCFSGNLKYGDHIRLVVLPQDSVDVKKSIDMTTFTSDKASGVPESGRDYIFFLIKSENKKSSDYFEVNPFEGFTPLIGDRLTDSSKMEALFNIYTTDAFSKNYYKFKLIDIGIN